MTRVVITGAKGRMGQSLIASAPRFPDIQVVGKIDMGDDLEAVLENADVLIDFSFHSGTAVNASEKLCTVSASKATELLNKTTTNCRTVVASSTHRLIFSARIPCALASSASSTESAASCVWGTNSSFKNPTTPPRCS